MTYRTALIDLKNGRPLRIFIPSVARGEDLAALDGFIITADLAASLGLQTSTVRGEISKNKLGFLQAIPSLKEWLMETGKIPKGTGKINFAASALWLEFVRRHVASETFAAVKEAFQKALTGNEDAECVENISSDYVALLPRAKEEEKDEDDVILFDSDHVEDSKKDQEQDFEEACPMVQGKESSEKEEEEDDDENDDDDDHDNDEEDFILVPSSQQPEDDEPEGSGSDSSSSSDDDGIGSDESSSDCSSSSDEMVTLLPKGVPPSVLNIPDIPSQFSASDFTKSHALKPYDINRGLKKELKKMRSWWIKRNNPQRKSKAISETTADKRQERLLCFLGFVHRYKAVPEGFDLTVGLVLNHRLVDAFCEYMKVVRQSSDGNMSENMTALISACKWLYRKEKHTGEPQMIRRLMDYRNAFQSKAVRTRQGEDIEELTERGKWLSWQEFTAVIRKLRSEWERELSKEPASTSTARKLHDLLLLGLYSCTPARGSEIRLLQFISEEDLTERKGRLTVKKYVEAQQINVLTKVGDVWRMYVADFKNSRSFGVDATDLDAFEWWCELLETYLDKYRPLLVGDTCNHSFVFVTKRAKAFSGPYWSDYISGLLLKLTGVAAATNLLRSSFVTSFYDSDAASDPRMRESVAQVMRHSTKEAQKTYDRRTKTQRKRQGLNLIAKMASAPSNAKKRLAFDPLYGDVDAEETPLDGRDTRVTKTRRVEATAIRPAREEMAAVAAAAVAPTVVEFDHFPHTIVRAEGNQYLLAPMQRSPHTNAPVYFVPPAAHFFLAPKASCKPLRGTWNGREFAL